jgi:tRNA(Ile)-lysidine synthase
LQKNNEEVAFGYLFFLCILVEEKYLCKMLQQFKTHIRKKLALEKDTLIIVALSGGVDSMVMTELFYQLNQNIFVAHCNFQLRGMESDRDSSFVKNYCKQRNIPHEIKYFDTKQYAKEHGISIQMAARDLRYAWFESLRVELNASYIATAHHRDDLAETFLINLMRGTGISGLHGIPAKTSTLIRPMLFLERKEIEEFASQNHISFVEDSSNAEDKYLRNQVRHQLMPKFVSHNPNFLRNLSRAIEQVDLYERIASKQIKETLSEMLEIKGEKVYLDIDEVVSLEGYEAYLMEFLQPYGFNLTTVEDLLENLHSHKSGLRFFSSSHRLIKDRNRLIISPLTDLQDIESGLYLIYEDLSTDAPFIDSIAQIDIPHYISSDSNLALIDMEKLTFPLIIRPWSEGDAFYPLGMNGRKLISDYFIDHKFSLADKEETWLLCSGEDVVWIMGSRLDDRFKLTRDTKKVIKIKLK